MTRGAYECRHVDDVEWNEAGVEVDGAGDRWYFGRCAECGRMVCGRDDERAAPRPVVFR